MSKNVKSTDPRKALIMVALKKASGANKVTLVKEHADGRFEGHCLKGNRYGYESLGTFTVVLKSEFSLEDLNEKV